MMSQASSSTGLTRRSTAARNALQPKPLAVVAAGTLPTGVDLEAPIDTDTGLPLIICPDCRDVRVFAATTKLGSNEGKRYFKCPRKTFANVSEVVEFALLNLIIVLTKFHCLLVVNWMQGTCTRYWFEEEYVVFLHDNGYLPSASSTVAAASTIEVPEVVGRIVSLEQNLNEVKDKVGNNREGIGSCICLVCGCVNVTLFLLLAIILLVAVVFK
jgi:hypothetical protein